jgi:hypothetical protein
MWSAAFTTAPELESARRFYRVLNGRVPALLGASTSDSL